MCGIFCVAFCTCTSRCFCMCAAILSAHPSALQLTGLPSHSKSSQSNHLCERGVTRWRASQKVTSVQATSSSPSVSCCDVHLSRVQSVNVPVITTWQRMCGRKTKRRRRSRLLGFLRMSEWGFNSLAALPCSCSLVTEHKKRDDVRRKHECFCALRRAW